MTNPHTGIVTFEANGRTYRLQFSVNALCMLEGKTAKGFPKLIADLADPEKVTLTLMRQLVWAALQEHHNDITINAAGELIASVGMMAMMQKLTEAITLAFPPPEEAEEPARPLAKPTPLTGLKHSNRGAA